MDAVPAAPAVSRALSSTAAYFDSVRQRHPATVLANEYIAFKSTFQRVEDEKTPILSIPSTTTDYNQLHFWEPHFTPRQFLGESFHVSCIAAYEEFRIRCVKVTLFAMNDDMVGTTNDQLWPVHSWIWYPGQHHNLVPADELGTYSDMLESGERVVPVGKRLTDNLVMRAVPQATVSWYQASTGQSPVIDVPANWMATNAANLDATLRMPYFVWRQRYTPGAPAVGAQYQVTMSAIVEFRNPKDSAL